jgi:hypothetical protein
VLSAVVGRCELAPTGDGPEPTARRSITFSPARGATVVLRDRRPAALAPADHALVTV